MTHDRIIDIEERWKKAKRKYGKDNYRFLPVPVIYAGSPADAEYITKELSSFLYAAKIMYKTNHGHEDYLLFSVGYTDPNNRHFPAVQEFYNHVRSVGGYYGAYRGAVLVDVSEWRGHFKERYFDVFISYLADRRMNGLIPFFYVNCGDSDAEMRDFEAVVSVYFSLIRVTVNATELCKYGVLLLEARGVGIDKGARLYLEDFFRGASQSDLFHGSESVRRICEGVARKCSPGSIHPIDEVRLKEIIKDLGYWDIFREKPVKRIGFR